VRDVLAASGRRRQLTLAFAGGVALADLRAVRDAGADVVDLGRAILDAPLWDLHVVVSS
jgi:nicotinate-nucleotide pyrophosphorylase (carboxylating)